MNEEVKPPSITEEYGYVELPSVVDGHRTFVSAKLMPRYTNRTGKEYILILHRLKVEHFILGVYTDLKEALQTRYAMNTLLYGGGKFNEAFVAMVHHISGPPVEDKFFDVETDTVKDFEAPEGEEETPPSTIIQP